MNVKRSLCRAVVVVATGLAAALCAVPARAQDDLGGAKTLYVNASYDEALSVLDTQSATVGLIGTKAAELHHYRALCLIALGRAAEADQAIALSVSADPFSVPDTSELAPRVASVFTAARARLVPEVARAALVEGRELMQKGDPAAAHRRFEAVTKLLSEPGLAGRPDLSDLALAAGAFTELTRAQMAAAPAAATAPPPPALAEAPPVAASSTVAPSPAGPSGGVPVSGTPAAPARAAAAQPPPAAQGLANRAPAASPPTDSAFVAAFPITQALPRWQPENGTVAQLGFSGAVRVTIDATGKVTGAVMDRPVYPPYDRLVLAAAREWSYRPATRNGQPVSSERLVEIVLQPRVTR
jgi:TonB family protein